MIADSRNVNLCYVFSEPPQVNLVNISPPRLKRPTNFQKGLKDRDIGPDFYVLLLTDYVVCTKEALLIL